LPAPVPRGRDEPPPGYEDDEALHEIFALVRDVVGVGFDEYKTATFQRRLARRMALCGSGTCRNT